MCSSGVAIGWALPTGSLAPSGAALVTDGSAESKKLQFTRLHLIANNTRFLIPGAPGCFPNLVSFTLNSAIGV